jgi:hypothetical protein
MLQEIKAAKRAPKQVRDNLRGEISGKGGHGAGGQLPAAWSTSGA